MQNENDQNTPAPAPFTNPVKRTVIQPLNDLSAYKQPEQPVPTPVAAPATTTQAPTPAEQPEQPGTAFDPSKIYPTATSGNAQAVTTPTASAQPLVDKPDLSKLRVASRVPSLQVYSIIILVYGAYQLYAFFSLLSLLSSRSALFLVPFYRLALILIALNMLAAVYLLISRRAKTASVVLTVLLVVNGLSLLNSIVSLFRYISHTSTSSWVSVILMLGMFVYLWNVKSQVDAANS